MKKCIFFDRDGIVNRSPGPGYVTRWQDFKVLPEFVKVLELISQRHYAGVVVTNQSGVARGCMSRQTVEDLHRRLQRYLLDKHGLRLTDILYCPHDEGQCRCRKPRPGMLQTAAERHNIDLRTSWMIGDQERDIEAGRRAGCRTVLVSSTAKETLADLRVHHMQELVDLVRAGQVAAAQGEP